MHVEHQELPHRDDRGAHERKQTRKKKRGLDDGNQSEEEKTSTSTPIEPMLESLGIKKGPQSNGCKAARRPSSQASRHRKHDNAGKGVHKKTNYTTLLWKAVIKEDAESHFGLLYSAVD